MNPRKKNSMVSLFWLFGFVFVFFACAKDELTLPAKVNFEFVINEHHADDEGTEGKSTDQYQGGQPGSFTVDQGLMVIEAIEFNAKREQGKDVFFRSDFSEPLLANLGGPSESKQVNFDIPQGEYNRIDMYFFLGTDELMPLVLEGTFTRPASQGEFPIKFEYRFREEIQVRARARHGQQNIVLQKDIPANAEVIMDAEFLFRFINFGLLMNAETTTIGGQETILINENINSNIFNILANRIPNSMAVVFD